MVCGFSMIHLNNITNIIQIKSLQIKVIWHTLDESSPFPDISSINPESTKLMVFCVINVGVGGSTLDDVGNKGTPWTGVWHLFTSPIRSTSTKTRILTCMKDWCGV